MKSKAQVVNAMLHLDIPQLYDDVNTPSEILVKPKAPTKRVLARKRIVSKAKPRRKPSGKRWVLNKEVEEKAPKAPRIQVSKKRKSIFSHKKTRLRPIFRSKRNEVSDISVISKPVVAKPVIAKSRKKIEVKKEKTIL